MGLRTEMTTSGDIILIMCRHIGLANIQVASIAPKDHLGENSSSVYPDPYIATRKLPRNGRAC